MPRDSEEVAMSALVIDTTGYLARPVAARRPRAVVPVGRQVSDGTRPAVAASVATSGAGLRLTRRGRAVVAFLALLSALGVTFASQQAMAGEAPAAVPVGTHTVVAGETLWGIAGDVAAPGEDVRDVVSALMELNGLGTADVLAGQELLVPAP